MIKINNGQKLGKFIETIDFAKYCVPMIVDDNTSFFQCKKVATKIVNDALETKKIYINDEDEYFNKDYVIHMITIECNYYIHNRYLEECIARMKKKTRFFIRYLRQFSTSFKIIRQADVDDEKSQLNNNSYIINCKLGKMDVLMTIVDIPHMTSFFYIVKVDDIECDERVYMDSPDACENFMNFIFWVNAAKIGYDY
nr:MAG TPA: hypothetical protein [Caudoviricetes sp.]